MKNSTRRLTDTAILIALGTVLSLFKIDLPFGGGVTICSMLPLVIISFRYGWKWGGLAGFVYSVIQLMLGLDNVQYASSAVMAASSPTSNSSSSGCSACHKTAPMICSCGE